MGAVASISGANLGESAACRNADALASSAGVVARLRVRACRPGLPGDALPLFGVSGLIEGDIVIADGARRSSDMFLTGDRGDSTITNGGERFGVSETMDMGRDFGGLGRRFLGPVARGCGVLFSGFSCGLLAKLMAGRVRSREARLGGASEL